MEKNDSPDGSGGGDDDDDDDGDTLNIKRH